MVKGSYTVEAAFMVPFILFTISGGIHLGYQLCQETKAAAVVREETQKLNVVKIVRKNQLFYELYSHE